MNDIIPNHNFSLPRKHPFHPFLLTPDELITERVLDRFRIQESDVEDGSLDANLAFGLAVAATNFILITVLDNAHKYNLSYIANCVVSTINIAQKDCPGAYQCIDEFFNGNIETLIHMASVKKRIDQVGS